MAGDVPAGGREERRSRRGGSRAGRPGPIDGPAPMIRRIGRIPPHFESRTLNRSAVLRSMARDRVGIAAERLVEHHRHAEPRAGARPGRRPRHAGRAAPAPRGENGSSGRDPLDAARPPATPRWRRAGGPSAARGSRRSRAEPRRVVLAGDAHLDLHLAEAVEPHLPAPRSAPCGVDSAVIAAAVADPARGVGAVWTPGTSASSDRPAERLAEPPAVGVEDGQLQGAPGRVAGHPPRVGLGLGER